MMSSQMNWMLGGQDHVLAVERLEGGGGSLVAYKRKYYKIRYYSSQYPTIFFLIKT